MELFQASRQWAIRPIDERFANLQTMRDTCKAYYDSARVSNFTLAKTSVITDGTEIMLRGESGATSRLTHHAFGQLAIAANAPANYLRTLPPDLVVSNLSHGFQHADDNTKPLKGLFHKNGGLICRCVTSQVYQRIWNYEICDRLIPLADDGWTVPPSMTDDRQPSGLYASDHDMFTFLVDSNHRIDDGTSDGLGRGFFCINSEVGQSAFKILTFYYRYVCGNHIVWGAENVQQVRIIHKGQPAKDWQNTLRVELTRYADSSASDDELKVQSAKRIELGANKDEVLNALFSKRSLGIAKKDLDVAYVIAETHHELNQLESPPNTVWGMVNGLTRHSQTLPYADERTKLDIAAGKVLEMAF